MIPAKKKSIAIGAMITAGTSVGAGMFSLPIVSSGMWSILSILSLLIIWLLSYFSAMYLLEANVQFDPGASFDTMVKEILGKRWNAMTGLAIAFIFYVLLYAYFSGFGSIIANTLGWEVFDSSYWVQGLLSLLVGSILAGVVWFSTKLVGRLSTILVFGMILSFALSIFGLAINLDASKLFDRGVPHSDYFKYVWAALPYYITSFGFASVVPSLYKYYGRDPLIIRNSLGLGAIFALLVYGVFILVSFGNISRAEFVIVNDSGGNIGDLINAFSQIKDNSALITSLTIFSNFAIVSSFLGVGLGLFDYIADKFSFANNHWERFYVACITFLPPGIASFFFPDGFIAAIGLAGLVLVYTFFILPYLMVKKVRKLDGTSTFRVVGGKLLLNLFLFASLMVAMFHVLSMFNYLPIW